MVTASSRLIEIYDRLNFHFGPQNWWPADTPFEVVVGAVLTQNTNWKNVEKSLNTLKQAGLLNFQSLAVLSEAELADHIRSSGYYNLKARRLKNLLRMIATDYQGEIDTLFREETSVARQALLQVKGIGPETADAILLFAGNHPIFVVDAYTHRILSRHNLVPEECDYQDLQDLFMDNLSHDSSMFNQYHALLVIAAKNYCKKTKPLCETCPLKDV